MLRRFCLTLDLQDEPALIKEYEAWHRDVWPEVLESLRDSGIKEMTIFRLQNRLCMIMEVARALLLRGEGRSRPPQRPGAGMGGADVALPAPAAVGQARREVVADGADLHLPRMSVALFIPCYVDQLYPQVARATLAVLEARGVKVEYPLAQSCCGQPMANAGCEGDAHAAARRFVRTFAGYDTIVAPSGSCVQYVRHHFDALPQTSQVQHVRNATVELSEFLLTLPEGPPIDFPYRVGVHVGCHALRGLRTAVSSELGPDSRRSAARPARHAPRCGGRGA